MIKTRIIILLLILFACNKKKENIFILKGKIDNLEKNSVITLLNLDDLKIIDSIKTKKGVIFFSDSIKSPFNARLVIKEKETFFLDFWIESGELEIKTNKQEIKKSLGEYYTNIVGSNINNIVKKYTKTVKPYQKKKKEAYKKLKDNLISQNTFNQYIDTIKKVSFSFFLENPNNYFSLSEINNYKTTLSIENLNLYYNLLTPELKKSQKGVTLKEYIQSSVLKIGERAPNIVSKEIDGTTVDLSSFKGKYILLDFWASWCTPCLKKIKNELPKLKEKYYKHELEIISYSFDIDIKTWKKSSNQLNINWINLCDEISMNNNPIAFKYNVSELPTSFIIDKNGIIVKKLNYNDNIDKELEKILFN